MIGTDVGFIGLSFVGLLSLADLGFAEGVAVGVEKSATGAGEAADKRRSPINTAIKEILIFAKS